MKISFKLGIQQMEWRDVVRLFERGDALGHFSTGWVNDHLYNPWYPDESDSTHTFEAFTTLAALSAVTGRLRLGTMVAANLFRHPAVVAKMAVTIDHITGGRFELGLGAGWHEAEHADHGIELMTPGARLDAFEEALRILRSLFDDDSTSFDGDHYGINGAHHAPRAVQPRIPLVIGGEGERRMLRIVAQHADTWNIDTGDPAVLERKLAVLYRHCRVVGRDPDEIEVSVQVWEADPTALATLGLRMRDAGAQHLVVALADAEPEALDRIAEATSEL